MLTDLQGGNRRPRHMGDGQVHSLVIINVGVIDLGLKDYP